MSTLQIVLLSIAGIFSIVSIVFMLMFIFEISVSSEEDMEETEVKSIFSSDEYVKQAQSEDVNSMLAKLDEQAEEAKAEVIEEVKEEKPVVIEEVKEETPVETVEEVKEEKPVVTEEVKEETPVEAVEESKEETPVETAEEVKEESPVETAEEIKEEVVETAEEAPVEVTEETVNTVDISKPLDTEMISVDNLPDYKARLETIVENRDKINKDLIKVEKSILNYERTKRRKIRNQKMLDRRASELTNLNLVMYSVTDIKNVDEEKKVKQEELTSHIAELKASIQDADEFLDSNKEKNEHDVKMAKFLIQEKARYSEEIVELEKLIAKLEGAVA